MVEFYLNAPSGEVYVVVTETATNTVEAKLTEDVVQAVFDREGRG